MVREILQREVACMSEISRMGKRVGTADHGEKFRIDPAQQLFGNLIADQQPGQRRDMGFSQLVQHRLECAFTLEIDDAAPPQGKARSK